MFIRLFGYSFTLKKITFVINNINFNIDFFYFLKAKNKRLQKYYKKTVWL